MDNPKDSPKRIPAVPGIIVTLVLIIVAIGFRIFGKPGAMTLTLPDHASNYTIASISTDFTMVLGGGSEISLTGVNLPTIEISPKMNGIADKYFHDFIIGKSCRIEPDPLITNSDPAHPKYYVYIDDLFLNLELIRKGFAIADTSAPFVFMDDFLGAEKTAWKNKSGLWAEYAPQLLLMRFESLTPEKQAEIYAAMTGKPVITNKSVTVQPGGIVPWEEAALYIGKQVMVEGKIVLSKNTGKVCYLNFHANYKKYLTAVIFASDLPKFSMNPEQFYLNKTVKISGVVKEYQGKPEIILNSPSQIVIIGK
ncbi:MAG: hypothetical protein HPY53_16065 [Brevinematales bacterium]|nr:hypothetical protein [Brevinematales bacterium]